MEHTTFKPGERVIVTINVMRILAGEEVRVVRVYAREDSKPGMHYVLVEAHDGRCAVVGETRLNPVNNNQ
jgi:hypothetical protein